MSDLSMHLAQMQAALNDPSHPAHYAPPRHAAPRQAPPTAERRPIRDIAIEATDFREAAFRGSADAEADREDVEDMAAAPAALRFGGRMRLAAMALSAFAVGGVLYGVVSGTRTSTAEPAANATQASAVLAGASADSRGAGGSVASKSVAQSTAKADRGAPATTVEPVTVGLGADGVKVVRTEVIQPTPSVQSAQVQSAPAQPPSPPRADPAADAHPTAAPELAAALSRVAALRQAQMQSTEHAAAQASGQGAPAPGTPPAAAPSETPVAAEEGTTAVLQKADGLIRSGEVSQARVQLKTAIEARDPRAAYLMALTYEAAFAGRKSSKEDAATWYRKAAVWSFGPVQTEASLRR